MHEGNTPEGFDSGAQNGELGESDELIVPPSQSSGENETLPDRERLINGQEIGMATATLYKEWYPGPTLGEPTTDKIRGDLALETIDAAKRNGYHVVVIEGGSSPAFLHALKAVEGENVSIQPQREKGMSASRREGLAEVAKIEGVKVLCYIDAEKVALPGEAIAKASRPILDDTADMVIPQRSEAAFATYPDHQVEFERQSNMLWNNKMREHKLMPEESPDLDVWFGPRFLKNDAEILKLFENTYQFLSEEQSGLKQGTLETWPNGHFLPVVAALYAKKRVVGIEVPYHHPTTQAAFEHDSEEYRKKRARQQEIILKTSILFIRYLRGKSGDERQARNARITER